MNEYITNFSFLDEEAYLLFGNKYFVQTLSTSGQNMRHVSDEHTYTHVLDYDYKNKVIYFADAPDLNQAVMRMNFDGSGMESLDSVHAYGIEGIAVDWINQ